jgi:peptide/nickel transport system permease protein
MTAHRTRRARVAALLLAVPVAVAVAGPFLAPAVSPPDGAPYALGDGHLLGTDGTGRDVLGLLLHGGRSTLGIACCAVALACVLGTALGLAAAASRHRWIDELLMRPVELILPIPSLLIISVVGVGRRDSPEAIALAVAAINVPAVARLVRAAALDAASGPVAEAMRMQGESRARVLFGYVGRAVLPVISADARTSRATAGTLIAATARAMASGLSRLPTPTTSSASAWTPPPPTGASPSPRAARPSSSSRGRSARPPRCW